MTVELFHVVPVPANDQLTVNWPPSIGVVRAQVIDVLGSLHFEQLLTGSSALISTERIPAGSHVLVLFDSDGHVLLRQSIVVAH